MSLFVCLFARRMCLSICVSFRQFVRLLIRVSVCLYIHLCVLCLFASVCLSVVCVCVCLVFVSASMLLLLFWKLSRNRLHVESHNM